MCVNRRYWAVVSLAVSIGCAVFGFAGAQTAPIHAQDPEEKGSDQGPSGWVQAPIPRGLNPNEKAAQGAPGAGQKPAGAAPGRTPDKAGQAKAGDNPGTPVANPLPGPSSTVPHQD
jgi:hypothetical protein